MVELRTTLGNLAHSNVSFEAYVQSIQWLGKESGIWQVCLPKYSYQGKKVQRLFLPYVKEKINVCATQTQSFDVKAEVKTKRVRDIRGE